MSYKLSITARKAAFPFICVVIVRAAIAAAEQAGIKIDESLIWTAAGAGYSALVALINWIKNHKKKVGCNTGTRKANL